MRLVKKLKSRRKYSPGKIDHVVLPGPDGTKIRANAEYLGAQELLKIQIEEGDYGAAMLAGAARRKIPGTPWRGGDRVWRSVVVHQRPFDPRGIFKHVRELKSFTMLIRSVPKDFDPFVATIDKAQSGRNKAYGEFLNGPVKEWVMPRKFPVYGRDAIVWADSASIIPRQSLAERTAALDGIIVPSTRIGSVLHSVLNRTGLPFDWNRLDQLTFASPSQILWNYKPLGYYAMGHKAYAFWVGVPNYNLINELMDLDVDIYMHLELLEGLVYAVVVLRAESEYAEWQTPDFVSLENRLLKLGGTWKRVGNMGVREAFRFFVPGSAPPKVNLLNDWKRHSLPHLRHQIGGPNEILPNLTRRVRQSDDVGGNVEIGKYDHSFFLRTDKKHNWLLTAQTETGKTTLANYIALQLTSFLLSIQLTHQAEEEAIQTWAKKFGGKAWLWDNLEDADNPEDELKLLRQDTEDAKREVEELFAKWRKEGWPELPLVIWTDSESIRYINKVHEFMKAFMVAWKPWWKETGEKCVLLLDDWVSIPSGRGDPFLGDIKQDVGDSFRKTIRWFADNCRKFGMMHFGTAHTLEEIDKEFPAGTVASFNVHIELRQDVHKVDVIDPGRRSVIAKDLDTRLPRNIIREIGR